MDWCEESIYYQLLVKSPRGIVFLKGIDTSNISKNVDNLFELLAQW